MGFLLNKGMIVKGFGNMSLEIDFLGGKAALNESQVPLLSHKSTAYSAENIVFREWIFKLRCGDPDAHAQLLIIDKKFRLWHRENAYDIEKIMNSTNNASLGTSFGYINTNTDRNYVKPPIAAENGVMIGDVIIDLLAQEGAHNYIIECTQIGENGADDIITTRTTTDAYTEFSGFVSGAKYSFRAQAILSNNIPKPWTEAVELRIN